MENFKKFCTSLLLLSTTCFVLFFGYILVDYHQTRIAYQELISIMESENSIRREWMAAGGDKEMLTQAIETNEKMIDGMKYNLGWGGRYSHD